MSLDADRSVVRLERLDRWLGACLTLVALGWLWLVQNYVPDIRTEDEPGPRGFPLLLGVVLAVFGVLLAVRPIAAAWWSSAARAATPANDAGGGASADRGEAIAPLSRREAMVAGGTFGLLVLYAFLLDHVGFLVGTPVVMALAMRTLLQMRRWMAIVSFAAAFTAACWLIFDVLLGTPLPRGVWVWS